MLKDSEIILLNEDKKYSIALEEGINDFIKDLVNFGHTGLKPNVTTMVKIVYFFAKSRYIRRELIHCTKNLLERQLNYELLWDRIPRSIKNICESDGIDFIWMRYDEDRVNALFNRSLAIMQNASYRDLIKKYSSTNHEKNSRLKELLLELQILQKATIAYIRRRGIFDDIITTGADEYYDIYGDKMIDSIVKKSLTGQKFIEPSKDIDNE
ncbi:MAG: hypothetical protein P1U56_23475 [Saprospiraceae bacterium]|nr:hypothetical protein [Saprospiraceae bacterium]